MGVLTDLVIADIAQAQSVAASNAPARDFGGLDAKGIDPVKLCQLKALLLAKPYDGSWVSDFRLVAGDKDEGPWVMIVPGDLVAAIAALPDSELHSTAINWHASEEFQADRWNAPDVETRLKEIHHLARKASSAGKAVLMWMSL
jgi:hypothetical protein